MSGFPFAAFCGQEKAKEAVMLALVAPALGGVLIGGENGSGKSVLLRSASVLAEGCELVELPLNVSEENLLGTVSLSGLLNNSCLQAEPGILARADGNILFIDDVNLLAGNIAAHIPDASSSGKIMVERDGLSEVFYTRFLLFGTCNMDERRIGRQLLERFGLFAEMEKVKDMETRTRIIKRQLEYEKDPAGFREAFAGETAVLKNRIVRARRILPFVEWSDETVAFAVNLCRKSGTGGNRAEILVVLAARAKAALDGREFISIKDVHDVSGYVLAHRAFGEDVRQGDNPVENGIGDNSGNNPGNGDDADSFPQTGNPDSGGAHAPAGGERGSGSISEPGNAGERNENAAGSRDKVFDPEGSFDFSGRLFSAAGGADGFSGKALKSRNGRKNPLKHDGGIGRYAGIKQCSGDMKDIALAATIRSAVPWQKIRKDGSESLLPVDVYREDLKCHRREPLPGRIVFFLVDASGSMGARGRMSAAKGAVVSLLENSYRRRDRVGMMTFRGSGSELVLEITRSVELAVRRLEKLAVGGRTPLAEAVVSAASYLKRFSLREGKNRPLLVIVSDGRANVKKNVRDGGRIQQKNLFETALKAKITFESYMDFLVVDTESGKIRLGLARRLADVLGAEYVYLEECRSISLAAAVDGVYKKESVRSIV